MLNVQNVNAGYGKFQALFNVSLDVRAGEAVAVIGPNGAGKSTLMRVISGMIPENRRLFPRMTVEDNLRMGCFLPQFRKRFEERRAFVYELFPRMEERRHQMAGTMSGGEQQMCAIGRALMSDPKILLMDEPSAGLAPVVVHQVFDLIEKIRSDGLTVLIVEQNVKQVLRVVDRAYILESGKLHSEGTSDELLQSKEIQKSFMGV